MYGVPLDCFVTQHTHTRVGKKSEEIVLDKDAHSS